MPVIRLRDQRRALLGGVAQTGLWVGGQKIWSAVADASAQRVIAITDYAGDCDDSLAFAMLAKAHEDGNINLIGIIVSSSVETSAPGVYGQMAAYGLADIPIYAYQGSLGTYNNRLSIQVRDEHGIPGQTRAAYQDDVTGLRTLLAAAPDRSVKIIDIGAPVSTARLLDSPADGISSMTGMELVAAKVSSLEAMAGYFTSATAEYNMTRDIPSSQRVYNDWPTPIIAHGFEIGNTVYTGPAPNTVYGVDPVKTAFDAFQTVYGGSLQSGGTRQSWDPITVHRAIWGNQGLYSLSATGSISVNSSGVSTFTAGAGNRQIVSKTATNATIAAAIEAISDAQSVFEVAPPTETVGVLFDMDEGIGTTTTSTDDAQVFNLALGATFDVNPTRVNFAGTEGRMLLDIPGNFAATDMLFGAVVRQQVTTGIQQILSISGIYSSSTSSYGRIFQLRLNEGVLEAITFAANAGTITTTTASVPVGTWALPILLLRQSSLQVWNDGVMVADVTIPTRNTTINVEQWLMAGARVGPSGGNGADFLNGSIAAIGYAQNATDAMIPDFEAQLRAVATAKGISIGSTAEPEPTSELATVAPNALQILDASTLGLADGATVAAWEDLSPNARDLTASGGPVYHTDGAQHWVTLDGVDDYLYRNEAIMRPAVEAGQTVTIQLAMRATPASDRRLVAEGHSTGGSAFYAPIQSMNADPQQLAHYLRSTANTTLVPNAEGVFAFGGAVRTVAVEDTGSVMRTYVDGVLAREVAYTQAAGDPTVVDRFAIGAILRNTASAFFAGDIFASVINPAAYSADIDAALAEIAGIDRAQPVIPPATFSTLGYVNDGDSLTAGHNGSPAYPPYLATRTNLPIQNLGVSGRRLREMDETYASRNVAQYFDLQGRNTLVLIGGANEIIHEIATVTLADMQASMMSYVNKAKATGYKVVVGTLPNSTYYTSNTARMSLRNAFNTWIRETLSAQVSEIVDLAALPELSDPTNTTYFVDGTHFTAAAADLAADAIRVATDIALYVPPPDEIPALPANSFGMALDEGAGSSITMHNGRTLTLAAPVAWRSDPVGLRFPGGSGQGTFPITTADVDGDMVWGAVVRHDNVQGSQIFHLGQGNTKISLWGTNADGTAGILSFNGTGGQVTANATDVQTPAATWNLWTGGFIGTSQFIRKNGVELASGTYSTRNRSVTSGDLGVIGARYNSGSYSLWLQGDMIAYDFRSDAISTDLADMETYLRAVAASKGVTLP